MKIRLAKRESIAETTSADPLKFYYIPVARSFYLARFADSLRLFNSDGTRFRRLLDVGCGSGIFLPELAKHAEHLIACDLHPNMDKVATMLSAESIDATVLRSDACSIPVASESIDVVVCMSVLEHIHDLESPANEFFRVLRPGGIAVVGLPVKNLLTDAILNMSYLTLEAKLEDEHVSNHDDVIRAFGRVFQMEGVLNIPRLLPERLRLYTTLSFRKPRN